MSKRTFDLSKMTVDDLFLAKKERRRRLANLPFEQKIAIVKKLQLVWQAVCEEREARRHANLRSRSE